MTGWKSSILGYMSSGDSVPEVITTVWYLVNTGLMAMEESRHLERGGMFLFIFILELFIYEDGRSVNVEKKEGWLGEGEEGLCKG